MNPSEELAGHSLLKGLLDELKPVLKAGSQAAKSGNQQRGTLRASLSNRHRYLVDVFERAGNVINTLERLELSGRLLFLSPSSLGRGRRSISRSEWTEHHFVTFTAALSSLLDTAILLAAEVYQLGLPPEQCKPHSVLKNHWVVGTPVAKELRSLEKLVASDRGRRNLYLHRGQRADWSELNDSVYLDDLRVMTWLHNIGKGVVGEDVLKFVWRVELGTLRPKIEATKREVTGGLQAVMSALEAPLKTRADLWSVLDQGSHKRAP